jgi:hypothetical protein
MARDPALLERLGPLMADTHQHLVAVWERGQKLGAVRTDVSASTLIALLQATKTSLSASLLAADRAATDDELTSFTHVYLDTLRRLTEARDKKGKR